MLKMVSKAFFFPPWALEPKICLPNCFFSKNCLLNKKVGHHCTRPGILKLLVVACPQIKILPFCVPPNQTCIPVVYPPNKKFYPNKLHLSEFFNFAYPCGLFTYPYGLFTYPRLRTAALDHGYAPSNPLNQKRWWLLYVVSILDVIGF